MIILWLENAVIYSAEYTDKKALTLIEHTCIMAILIFPWKGKLRPELNTSLYRCEFLSTSIHVQDGQMTEIRIHRECHIEVVFHSNICKPCANVSPQCMFCYSVMSLLERATIKRQRSESGKGEKISFNQVKPVAKRNSVGSASLALLNLAFAVFSYLMSILLTGKSH